MSLQKQFALAVLREIDSGKVVSASDLNSAKLRLSKELGLGEVLPNPAILSFDPQPSPLAKRLLGIKPVRTISGVAPLAIMTKPIDCLHGTCIFCPGGEKSVFGAIPKSYTGNEPASMRAISNAFDPYLQVFNRLYQFAGTNHNFQKIELIVMGGTFPSFPLEYQESFVAETYKALNDFSDWFFAGEKFDFASFNRFFFPPSSSHANDFAASHEKLLDRKGVADLKSEQKRNETAAVRLVTFCVETKPDWCRKSHIDRLLEFGVTRIELGVQSLRNDILQFSNRGHSVEETVAATQELKDSALKVTYHMMPGLPKSTPEYDVEMFRELFANPDFRPDALKIYPCMVMPGTPLFNLYQKGDFVPLSGDAAAEIIAEAKRFFPKYVRVQRVMRDIPTKLSTGEIQQNNLRQWVEQKCREKGIACQCIRCREAGHVQSKQGKALHPENARIETLEYEASKGTEVFISVEDPKENALFGFVRLRLPFNPFRPEIGSNAALVRELHVFGEALSFGEKKPGSIQHAGLGKRLLQEAERIAREEWDQKRVLVIAGIGAREYYRKLGYHQNRVFMEKAL